MPRPGIRRRWLCLAFVAVLAAAVAGGAEAAKPIRGPAAGPASLTFPAGLACPFALYAEAVVNNQVETIFADGTIVYTGLFVTRVENLENGKELTLVSQGPVRLEPLADALLLTSQGPLIFFFFPGDAGPGDVNSGRTYFFHGRTETVVDPESFAFLSFAATGKATDLCAALT